MAKSPQSRAHTLRLQKKWEKFLRSVDPQRNLECITFGKIFSRDPIDCGNPKCLLCSSDKVLHRKKGRAEARKEERRVLGDEFG